MMPFAFGRDLYIHTEESEVTPPSVEPIDKTLVKAQRRFSATTLDSLFDLWIAAARQHYEEQTGTQCITATREYWLDAFPWDRRIELPRPPLQSVASVEYLQADGTYATFIDDTVSPAILPYRVDPVAGEPARRGQIVLLDGYAWPVVLCQPKAVKITFDCGFGDTAVEVPAVIRHALLLLVGHFHKFGEEVSEARANILQLPIGAKTFMDARRLAALPQHRPTHWPLAHGHHGGPTWV
jgi:uncharacterized phiE125 gp8 family phage protein